MVLAKSSLFSYLKNGNIFNPKVFENEIRYEIRVHFVNLKTNIRDDGLESYLCVAQRCSDIAILVAKNSSTLLSLRFFIPKKQLVSVERIYILLKDWNKANFIGNEKDMPQDNPWGKKMSQ